MRAYRCPGGPVRTLLHADLYRLDRLQDVVDLGLGEMVEDDSVAVVEWGDVASSVFGPEVLTVELATGSPGEPGPDEDRILTYRLGGTWSARRSALAARLEPWTTAALDRRQG